MRKANPVRTCVACGRKRPKGVLVRVCKDKEGNVSLDVGGKMKGRGCYICSSDACAGESRKGRVFSRLLNVAIPDALLDDIQRHISREGQG